MRKIIVEVISTCTTAALAVAALLVSALLLRVTWEGIVLGWTGFGYWP